MAKLSDPLKSRLLLTLTGRDEGEPEWVRELEKGDDEGFFGPGSAVWAVHGDLPTLVAGVRALLTQALHPGAMAGVHDHSRYREDPFGRLAGTIRWIYTVSYGSRGDAERASAWVLRLHEKVTGVYPGADGESIPYTANQPDLLRWVHLAFTDAFLGVHEVWGRPIPGGPDAYVREWAKAGELMGVENPPRSRAELHEQMHAYLDSGALRYDERVADVIKFLKRPPLAPALRASYPILWNGAVASLDDEFRMMLRLRRPVGPAVPATAAILHATGRILGTTPGAEKAALVRLARLRAAV